MPYQHRKSVTQQEYDAFLREQVQGDWAKLENDDPDLIAALREFLGWVETEDEGGVASGEDAPDPFVR